MTVRNHRTFFALICIPLIFGACHKDRKSKDIAAVSIDLHPSATLDKTTVSGNSILRVKYTWKTGAGFKPLETDMMAKVHFISEAGSIIWQDDHPIVPSVKSWVAGQSYDYERIVYVPLITRNMKIFVKMGIYHSTSGQKFVLDSPGDTPKDKVRVAEISASPPRSPDDLPEARIKYLEGWYQVEKNVAENTSWRWMSDHATLMLKNPRRDAEFYLKGWVPSSILKADSKLTIMHGDLILGTFENLNGNFSALLKLDASIFGDQSEIEIKLLTEPSYIPSEMGAGSDTRRLAAMIHVCYFN